MAHPDFWTFRRLCMPFYKRKVESLNWISWNLMYLLFKCSIISTYFCFYIQSIILWNVCTLCKKGHELRVAFSYNVVVNSCTPMYQMTSFVFSSLKVATFYLKPDWHTMAGIPKCCPEIKKSFFILSEWYRIQWAIISHFWMEMLN